MKIKISKKSSDASTTSVDSKAANPFRETYIVHPQTRKHCTVMARPSGQSTELGERLFEVILPYTPKERLFGRRKGRLQLSTLSHSLMMSESKLNNLMLSRAERLAYLKTRRNAA